MNTEPPTGDELQQMLVSMKQDVLSRAPATRPAPRRRGRRAGIVIGVIAVLGIGATSGGVALGMIPQPFAAAPAPSPSSTTVVPSETPSESSAPVVERPHRPPHGDTGRRGGTGRLPRGGPHGGLRPAVRDDRHCKTQPGPTGASDSGDTPPALWCVWRDPRADVSGIDVRFTRVTSETVGPDEERFAEHGGSCSDQDGGRFCQMTRTADPYPVETTTTSFTRGDVGVEITQTNVPTDGLLKAIQQQVWG